MKKILIITTIILISTSIYSCHKSGDSIKGQSDTQPYCICEYAITPSFKAGIVKKSWISHQNKSDERLVALICLDEAKETSTRILNHLDKDDKDEFLKYAHKYNDLSYNRAYPGPNTTGALADPISKIKCFEISSSNELVDISDRLIFRALTFLPYIKSGYNDQLAPYSSEPIAGYLLSPGQYLVNKPLKDLMEEDLTLIDYKSFNQAFELAPISPYEFRENSKIEIRIEVNNKKQQIKAEFTKEPW